MKRYLCFFIMVGLLLVLAAPVAAQEAPTPEPVGLRPDAPTYAVHGTYWVGMTEFFTHAPSHPSWVTVWYPALNPDGEAEDVTYSWNTLPITGHALRGAAPNPQDGPYPLVIVAHGWEGARLGYTYLCEHLASRGFVIVAIDFADSGGTNGAIPAYSTLFTRPQDISWAIDQAVSMTAAGGKLEGMIDTERIAVAGHSEGGRTALQAAGAEVDFTWYQHLVDEPIICIMPDGGNWCAEILAHQQQLADLAGLDTIPDKLWPSWGDPRVDVIVGLAPSGGYFGPQGLEGVTIPALLMGGSKDTSVSPEFDIDDPYEQLGSATKALVTFQNADHAIFLWKCSEAPWLLDFDLQSLCSDPVWDMDRAHDLINHFTTAFLLDTLKGDKEAAAALVPDAVSFPGIKYQAQGF